MRLPYLQLAMEVIEQAAPDIAVELDADEAKIGWGLVKSFRWSLGRCPEHRPPSWSSVVEGPTAAKLIARAAGYQGDPERFVDACCRSQPAILERTDTGVRFRGLDRYDGAWKKNHKEEWAQLQGWMATQDAPIPVSGANPGGNRGEPGATPPGSAPPDTDTDTYKETTPPNPLSGEAAVPPGGAEKPSGGEAEQLALSPQEPLAPTLVDEVMAYYVEAVGHALAAVRRGHIRPQDSPDARRHIEDRLTGRKKRDRRRWTVDDCKRAIDGLTWSDHHMHNGFHGIQYALRSSEQMEMMIARRKAA